MDMTTLLKKTPAELQALLATQQDELRTARFAAASMQLNDVRKIRRLRQDIARIQTALHQLPA